MPSDPPPSIAIADAIFARRRRVVLSSAFVVGVLLRVVVYHDLVDTPALSLMDNVESDMAFFWDWAGEIEQDVLQNRALHPLHSWHRNIADQVFLAHPALLGEPPGQVAVERYKTLWDGWYGGKRYHQEPLYAYFLAAIRGVSGDKPVWVYLVQMGLGLGTLLLLYRVTENAFGATAATAALAMGTLCAPLLYYELFLLRASLITFATLLLVLLAQRIDARPSSLGVATFGFCVGLAITLKVSFLLFGGLAMSWLVMRRRLEGLPKKFLLFAAGCSIPLSAVVLRNLIVGAAPLGLTSVGAVTFAATNYSGYVPVAGWFVEPAVMGRIMFDSAGDFLGTIAATVGTHDSILSWGRLLFEKTLQLFHWREISNNTNLYYDSLHSPLLRWLPVGFGVVAPFSLFGFALCMRRRRGIFIVTQALLTAVPLIGFYVLSRLRVSFLAALIPLAAFGMTSLLEWLWQERYRRAGLAIVAIGSVSLFIQRDAPSVIRSDATLVARPVVAGPAFELARTIFYGPKIAEALESGDLARAALLSEGEIATQPSWLKEIDIGNPPRNQYETGVVSAYLPAYSDATAIARRAGNESTARRYESRFKELRRARRIAMSKH